MEKFKLKSKESRSNTSKKLVKEHLNRRIKLFNSSIIIGRLYRRGTKFIIQIILSE